MELKFIFKMARGLPWREARAPIRRQNAGRCPLFCIGWLPILVLVAAVAFAPESALFAQQSDQQPPAQQPGVPSLNPVAAPDPPAADDSTEAMFPHFKDTRFWLSGQINFIFQTHPEFHALYSGAHSLDPDYEKATSRVMTLYTGARVNNSTEFLVD